MVGVQAEGFVEATANESQRRRYDEQSYLQKFTPRRAKKTRSERNLQLVKKLTLEGRMQPAGYRALGLAAEAPE